MVLDPRAEKRDNSLKDISILSHNRCHIYFDVIVCDYMVSNAKCTFEKDLFGQELWSAILHFCY